MATAQKAPANGKPAVKKTTAPALDFGSLTVEKTAAPTRQGSSGVDVRKTPVYQWVKDSWNEKTAMGNSAGQPVYRGTGRQVIVPSANAGQIESLIRRAAQVLSTETGERIGAAIASEELTGANKGKTAVKFCAKTGKAPYKRNKPAATPTATPAA